MLPGKFYLLLLFWCLGFIVLWKIRFLPKGNLLGPPFPKLSILIPARNEERNLSRLLISLRSQNVIPHEVIVIDDQSSDATAEVARREGCRVIPSKDLPEGWTGKNWACWQGAQQATGDLFLFLDADTVFEPEGLEKIVSTYLQKKGLLSVQPYHWMEKAYERLSAFFNLITIAGVNAFGLFGSRVSPSGAFGPCMVCSKEDYEKMGGHAGVKGEVLESLALGKKFVKAHLPLHCYGGKGALVFRMYPAGWGSLIEGFSKGFGTGAKEIPLLSLLMIVGWIFGAVGSARELIQSSVLASLTSAWGWGLLYVLYLFQLNWMLRRIGNFGFLTALFYPIPLLFFISIFLTSVLRIYVLRRVRWKGRVVRPGLPKG